MAEEENGAGAARGGPNAPHPVTMQEAFETQGGVFSPEEDQEQDGQPGLIDRLKSMIGKGQPEEKLRDAIDDYIEQAERNSEPGSDPSHDQSLISNVIKLRDLTVVDVMIPRADIVAIEIGTSQRELLALLAERQYSRLPVYRETLDDVVGAIHIKDVV